MQKTNLLHFGIICCALLLIVTFVPVPKVSAGTSVLWHNRNPLFEPGQLAYSAGYALLTDRSTYRNLGTNGQQVTISLYGANNLIGHFGGSNYLGVGMATTSFDNTYGGIDAIDYGWSYVAYFNDSGGPYLNMECWRVGEYYGGDECYLSDGYYDPSIHMYDDITLKMEWAGSSVVFSVQAGLTNIVVNTFSTANRPTMSHYFEVGAVKNGYPILGGPDVKYFQFAGVWSSLENPGPDLNWFTSVTNPKFMLTNETFYRSVSIAYTTVSIDSYLDNGWRWGGDFCNVEISAGIDRAPSGVILQEWIDFMHWANQQRNTGSGVLLWYISPLSLTISIGSGSGSIQPYTGTKTHTYSTYVTVTATPAAGYNFDHWLLQTSTGSWLLTPATYPLCMNADYSLTAYFVAARAYYVSSIYAYGKVGTGSVINPNNLIGSSNDGNYATLYAGNYGDSAYMTANMNAPAAGHVYLYGYSRTGYTSHLVVSVSYNGQSWITLFDQMLSPRSSPYYIDCGSTASYFSYIKLFVDYHNGYSACVDLDAVRVTGPIERFVSSINSQGHSSGGAVNNPNNLIGANDGQYTHLHASNSGDYAWIVGNMNTPATGHVYVYGYSSAGYTSHLVVSVSSNGYSWTTLSNPMISPGSSPYYIDCGSTASSFSYIKFYVDYYTGYSAGLNLDAVHVLS